MEDQIRLARLHVKPELGNIQLKNLKSTDLQGLYNRKFNSGLSARSVQYIHVVIHNALEQAVKNNLVIRNVSDATTLPRKEQKEMRVLSIQEQAKFMNILDSDRLGFAYMFDLATGLRVGELLALRWKDVDLENGVIKIKQAVSRVKNYDPNVTTKTKLIIQEPKTKKGQRSIPLPNIITALLKKHQLRQKEEKLLYANKYQDNDLVFCTKIGTYLEPRNLSRTFYTLVANAGIDPANMHALRHSFATRLLEANEHPKVVQEMLGHSSITLTLDTYSHVMPELKQAAAEKLNDLFDLKKSPTPAKV